MVREVCDSAVWLDHGRVVSCGPLDEVYGAYAEWQKSGSSSVVYPSLPEYVA
jgi:ABC-type polysaccharide/polyol phosphate transport system ATPase subunit